MVTVPFYVPHSIPYNVHVYVTMYIDFQRAPREATAERGAHSQSRAHQERFRQHPRNTGRPSGACGEYNAVCGMQLLNCVCVSLRTEWA